MRYPPVFLSGLLLGAALPGRAQTTATPPAPRFYVGLGAYSSFFQPIGGRPRGVSGFLVPLQLTAGYQLRPRLAVQVGVAYSGSSDSYSVAGYYYPGTNPRGTYFAFAGNRAVRNTSVSALARYTLTRKPAHRVQFDLLGGLGLEHRSASTHGTESDSLAGYLKTTATNHRTAENALLFSLGPSLRYRLSPRFELNFDFTLHYAVPLSTEPYAYRGLTSSSALGLRYRFGRR